MSNLPAPGVYDVDAVHSTVGFIARHLVASKVRGRFPDFTGVIIIGESAEASSDRRRARWATAYPRRSP